MSPPATSAAPCIRLRGLTRVLDSGGRPLTVLDSVDLDVDDGEFVAILGPSGSGKSTLLALLAGLDRPTAGEVLVHGRPVHALDEDALARWRRADVGFVFQSFQLLDTFTAEENVMFPMELLGRPGARARARDLLEAVGLGARGHHYPRQLSGGEQQRVAVARAFAAAPRLLLADEPTGNLDGPTGRVVLDALDRLRQEAGTTVVLVTHDPAIGARAQRRVRFRDGRVESDERGASA